VEPATVLTTPAAVILRTVWLPRSATKTWRFASTAIPNGTLKWAALPVPSALPFGSGSPATVDQL
jgi:hypothetical protein